MSDFMNQLNEKVPDHKTNVTSINSRRLKTRIENGKIIKNRNNLLLLFRGEDIKLNKLFKYNEATKNVEVTRNQQLSDYITIKHGLLSDDTIRQLWLICPNAGVWSIKKMT